MLRRDDASRRLSELEYALAGASSGFVTRFLSQPIDVLKIRFQIQSENVSGKRKPKYRGMVQASRKILREEGFHAFWKGHVPAQFLQVTYSSVQFGTFELYSAYASRLFPAFSKQKQHVKHFICGTFAGVSATTASFPLDLIRTCLVAQGEPKVYSSMYSVGRRVIKKNGLLGLYKGLGPSNVQVAPYTGFQFGFYSVFMNFFQPLLGREDGRSMSCPLFSGAFAGFAAKSLVYPLDVVKKRLQIQDMGEIRASHFGKLRQYDGLVDCIRKMVQYEGFKGLYKGYVASSWKASTEYALAGAGSGIITRLLCQPFDVLKIRFQIQTEMRTSTTKPKYRSLIQATKKILREEGSQAFWKGHLPAQLLSIAFGGVQFTSFELFTKIAWLLDAPGSGHSGHHHGHILHFFCGVCAGVTATTLTFPLDLIRTCLVAQGEPKIKEGKKLCSELY
ncbi:unnamed protein product [Notodromas monacha]|uniref:Mitochondrial thiamine pyrophosphate carrier n=1 Tax=Notodromas monacha TaxID=399045 RepID=A0A7R9GE45_9CRUS|nr:unnamed protein product [Notodromas monacha]CAG0919224.1 unnamed protein product [Notodromas monacha]